MTRKKKAVVLVVFLCVSLVAMFYAYRGIRKVIKEYKVYKKIYLLQKEGKVVKHNDKDTKSITLDKITSVQIINLDRSKDRREIYEGHLKKNFGEKFLGLPIGDEIRLSGVDGKKVIVFENIITNEKIMYNDIIKTEEDKKRTKEIIIDKFKDGVYKVYSVNNPEIFALWSYNASCNDCLWYYKASCQCAYIEYLFNKFGVKLSMITAINNIAKQPDGTYGLIFEDDFLVDKDFYSKLENVLSSVPNDFDALKLSLPQGLLSKGYKSLQEAYPSAFKKLGVDTDWVRSHYIYAINSIWVAGNQGFLVSAEGARKIVNWYHQHLSTSYGTDIELWHLLGNTDYKIKNYLYCQDVPILLHSVYKHSVNVGK